MPDRLTPEQRSRLMARVPSRDTGIEIAVRRAGRPRGFLPSVIHRPFLYGPDTS